MSIGVGIAEAIDAVLTEPVFVIGSPPATGRDLDLLAWDREYDAIARCLTEAGFLQWRNTWARFKGTTPYGVELFHAESRFPECYRSVLLQGAESIPGLDHLVRPGPAGVLLLAAYGVVSHRGGLTAKSRARVAWALERDPQAWTIAEQHAPGLGLLGAVRLLRRAYQSKGPLPTSARIAGMGAICVSKGSARAKGRVFAKAFPRRLRPEIVSFSGLDGSGKSTQIELLRETLDCIGVSASVKWAGFSTGWRLHPLCAPLARSARSARGGSRGEPNPPRKGRPRLRESAPGSRPDPFLPDGMDTPRRQQVWVGVVAVVNAIKQWSHVLQPRRGTKVLIFDRFSPDSAVKLDFFYKHERQIDVSWQRTLFHRLSPKPDVGFLVAVPGEVAHARVGEWEPDQLDAMSRMYEQQVGPYRLVRLDGTEPPEDLARRIAVTAWQGIR